MKRKILDINFGYEVKWQEVKSDKVNVAIHQILDENKAKCGIHHADSGLFGYVEGKELANCYSAAVVALNAITEQEKSINAVIEKMPSGRYWIVGMITDSDEDEPNQLINGFDSIVDEQDLIAEVDELVGILREYDFEFKYLADQETAELIESEIGIAAEEIGTLETLLKELESVKVVLKDAKITNRKGVPAALIAVAAVVILAAGGMMTISGGSTDEFSDMPFSNEFEESLPMVKKSKTAKEVEKELLEAAYAEEIEWLRDDFKKQDSVKLINAIVEMHKTVPQYIAGWNITSFEYSSENPKAVIAKAKRTVFGTPITLKEGAENYERINLIGSSEAEIIYKLPDIKKNVPINDVINYIKQGGYKTVEMAHDSHYLGLTWDVNFADTDTRREEIKGITDKKKATVSQLKTSAKGMIIQGKGVGQLETTQLMLNKATTTIVNTITLDRKNGVNWKIEGIVYER